MALKKNATLLTSVKTGKKNQLFFTRRVNTIRDTSCFKNVHSEYKPCNALSQASLVLHTSSHARCSPSLTLHTHFALTRLHLFTISGLK